jgi:hypothetical protein
MKFFFILTLWTSISFAGIRDVGNGGVGVLIDDQPYLLDLYEAGITKPSFDKNFKPLPQFSQRVQDLHFLTREEKLLLALKLTEFEKISPLTANSLALGLPMFTWRLLDQNLVEIPERSPIDLKPLKAVQLANRFGSTIRFNQKYWNLMDAGNRVALVLHELFYAYAPLVPLEDGTEEQQSAPIREMVGYVFSSELSSRGSDGFESFASTPRRISKIISNSEVEYMGPLFEASSKEFFGFINLFENGGDDRWVFCANLKAALASSKTRATSGEVHFPTRTANVQFAEYVSPTGSQKRLVLVENPEDHRLMKVGGFSFNRSNENSCKQWVENKIREIRAIPSLN